MISATLCSLGRQRLGIRSLGIRSLGLAIAAAMLLHVNFASAEDAKVETTKVETAKVEDTKVMIDNFTFEPAQLTVKVGTTVTWTNRDDIPHTIVSAGKFRSKTMDTDGTFSFTFTTAGEYKYFCSLHPHMTGTVKVE
ncbi:cupredoxin domain-containing protein [Bradyrhizobium sp. AZCC 2289]|uniref:cupredoxin domain-containing protein n=1 Tax=Bradyrhizobium sp. AZCC 2289 TaxID=3117026 RepID=UPI002FF26253